jgi:hypothetical protein
MADDSLFDIPQGKSYSINNLPVLSANTLGSGITRSSLRQLGPLNNLTVYGDVDIGQFLFYNSNTNRIGINTEEPNGVFSVAENNVELVLNSPGQGVGTMGTFTSHDLGIITDNTIRITVKGNGEIHAGSLQNKTNFYVHGTLHADNVVYQTSVNATQSLEFQSVDGSNVYGIGLKWTGIGTPKQLILESGPNRIWSSENIDLSASKYYAINGKAVLDASSLGSSITTSSLTKLGFLEELNVAGTSTLGGPLISKTITSESITISSMVLDSELITVQDTFKIKTNEQNLLQLDLSNFNIGCKDNTNIQARIYGKLSIGITKPDPEVTLAVSGNISFGGKKFISGTTSPEHGFYNVGDICWSTNPNFGEPVGWVCIVSGDPGTWGKFGLIS